MARGRGTHFQRRLVKGYTFKEAQIHDTSMKKTHFFLLDFNRDAVDKWLCVCVCVFCITIININLSKN